MSAPAADRPFVLILGMHRSGTSCLAGALETCGLYLGEVRRTGTHNAKGYFEPAELVRTHDRLLALNGGAWHRPPARTEIHEVIRAALRESAETLSARRPCGLKDPRLLLIDDWATIPDAPVRSVGTFRHPLAVAASLERRNGMPVDQGLALWLYYNHRLIERHRSSPFPLIAYDLSEPDRYRRAVATVARSLGLKASVWRLWRFVSGRLDHHGSIAATAALPAACAEAYDYLTRHSLQAQST